MLDSFQVFILRESAGKKLEDLPGLCGTARKFDDAVFRFRSDSKARDVHDQKNPTSVRRPRSSAITR